MRKTITTIIVCCFAFFSLGWFAVVLNWLPQSAYLTVASLVGTFASVMGLIALSRPAISRRDLQELEIDNLSRLAASTAQLGRIRMGSDQSN